MLYFKKSHTASQEVSAWVVYLLTGDVEDNEEPNGKTDDMNLVSTMVITKMTQLPKRISARLKMRNWDNKDEASTDISYD